MEEPGKRLYRSTTDRMVAGVVGGLAEYLGIDASLLRLLVVTIGFFSGFFPAMIVYLIAWIIIPEEPR